MELLERYLTKIEYDDYADFKKNYKVIVPNSFDFSRDIVDEWARLEEDKLALIYVDDDDRELRFTFKDVSYLSKKIAGYLKSIGIKKGDKVLTLLRRHYSFWLIAVATARLGAVLVPVSTQMETKDLTYRVNASNAKAIIAVDDEFVKKQIAPLKERCPTLQTIAVVDKKTESEYLDFNLGFKDAEPLEEYSGARNNDDMIIFFTSGTTAYPKQTIHSYLYPLGHIITAKYLHQVENNGLHITQADSGWAKFGWGNIYGQWICGTAILGYDPKRFEPKKFTEILRRYRPTTLCLPPTMYRMLLRDGLQKEDVKGIKNFTSAGEALTKELNVTFKSISGKYIREGFGQSEGTPIFANWKYIDVKLSSMGKATPQSDVRLINQKGDVANAGEAGEVVLIEKEENIGILKGYVYDKKFIAPFVDGKYKTGDIAYLDKDGYAFYVGRNDDVIKCSGYRISPYEIEGVLNEHEAVKESAIIGMPDSIRGQIVCAVIVLKDGFNASEELTKSIQNFVKQNTAPYKYPRVVKYVEEIKKTTSGKIERKSLKNMIN